MVGLFEMKKAAEVRDTKHVILKNALQLFLKKGYRAVTYQDLMKKTGLSKGAIYHHFASKDELLEGVFGFLLDTTRQPAVESPEDCVTDRETFRELFVRGKLAQIQGFKKITHTRSLKVNRLLFFLEAINENDGLKQSIEELMQEEKMFLVKCFTGLQKHNRLPPGKDPALLAECLFWMLQGSEMRLFVSDDYNLEADCINGYNKTIDDFFAITGCL